MNHENEYNTDLNPDTSFNNQGIEPVDNRDASLPNTTSELTKFGKGLASGVKNGMNAKNNLALGLKKPNNKADLGKKDKKDNNPSNDKNNPATGQKNDDKNKEGNKKPNQKTPNLNNKKTGNNKGLDKAVKAIPHPAARAAALAGSKLGIGKNKKDDNNNAEAQNLNQTVKSFNVLGMKLTPIQIRIAVSASIIIILVFAFLIFLAILNGTIAGIAIGTSDEYCGGETYDLSVLDNQNVSYTYTGAFDFNWGKNTNQYKNFASLKTYADEDGFLRSGNAYLIALGSYFGIEEDGKKKLVMGTEYLIKLKNGTEFVGILADAKADKHTTESSQHAQHYKDRSVVEFEMACGDNIVPVEYGFNFTGEYNKSCSGAQSAINKKFSGEIESISLLDSSGETCVFENGQFPIRTKYFSQSDMNKIFAASPASRTQKQYYPFECVTYAKLRAVEILLTATNISDDYRKKAIKAINDNRGNGGDWHAGYKGNSANLYKFNNDPTCTKPKTGSIISWQSGSVYGHVGIIEAVEGDKAIITDGYKASPFNYHEVSVNQVATLGGRYGKCYGITYLFEYKG